jgi:ribulose-5-phosphate 4-epimerase/fuculose-1-phosphate aldolase
MRVAPLGIVPYFRPGSAELAGAIEEKAVGHNCLVLRNHGLITIGSNWNEAVDRAEELEETAKLYFLLRGSSFRELTPSEVDDLARAFPSKGH